MLSYLIKKIQKIRCLLSIKLNKLKKYIWDGGNIIFYDFLIKGKGMIKMF